MPLCIRWPNVAISLTLAFALMAGLGACASGPNFANLEARVVSDEPLDLPPDAELSVRLTDMSQTGANLIAEASYVRLGNGPIPVMLRYDAEAIDEGDTYVLRADIRTDDRLLYTTTDPVPVLTGDAPDNDVTLAVERVER
ncbi:YbaY family lipoprotein [Halomonas sp. McH1-25]|uniref:YbaY family lipoprotein n=1 Tax=unclassified Halomonas TaxID=2609666 RepID=UPI001EF6D230|nr:MULTISPECIES: YbaY family lipoprotein [unclassified Halomonas]MCG7601564.1 YbaY family lipoprotein [Halomonas sp. McH1-25]MCP1343362.1 YbaY family lipoprotein [Halomonas sp. FL8]MCP1362607.1 YbaY family lipoprotein [Halomonas sp. BBD45]MCP1366517.1 YbaY family lipoprotein [Halomonas sp. BBD48]